MTKNKIFLELIWWLVTAVIIVMAMLPIYSSVGEDYPFYKDNIFIIIIAVTFIRYIFLLKHHWLSISKWTKALFIFVPIPVFFYLTGVFYDFQAFSDEKGINSVLTKLSQKEQFGLSKYIRTEMVLFWSAAILANAFMPIRMIISLWREINKGTH